MSAPVSSGSVSTAFGALPRPHPKPWPLTASEKLLERARARIPTGTLSMMKQPEHFCPGSFPIYLQDGHGALVRDVDDNEYIDFVCGLGASALGHRHPDLERAAMAALERGFIHSLPHPLEVEAAELLCDTVGAEMVRFFKTGADATAAAIRLARAHTGRDRVFTVGYNGWHDVFQYDTPGVPEPVAALSRRFPLFTPPDEPALLDAVAAEGGELAAVIVALPYNRRVDPAFLAELKVRCADRGALLIFDEIVTGFRLGIAGAQSMFGVTPDLSTYSKALAAGMPLSAVTGPERILKDMEKLQVSTTFGGELASLAVAIAALRIYRETDHIERCAALGRRMKAGLEAAAKDTETPLKVLGYDPLPLIAFAPMPAHIPFGREFQGRMAERGVVLRRDLNFICGAHTEAQVDFMVAAAKECLVEMSASGVFEELKR